MSFKDPGFGDRLASAANAKKAAFDKFRAKPAPDDPAVLKRQEERAAIQAAREERARAREIARIKAEEEARLAQIALEARLKAEEEERLVREELEYIERKEREAALEAEKKAARDARYAARKARR